jgi:hypothetical protein
LEWFSFDTARSRGHSRVNTAPPNRRPNRLARTRSSGGHISPYIPKSNAEASPSAPLPQGPLRSGNIGEVEVILTQKTKEVIQTQKTKEAAEKRRKNVSPWSCNLCDCTFTTKFKRGSGFHSHQLLQLLIFSVGHIQAHSESFKCSFDGCGKTFASKSDVARHENSSRMHERDRELRSIPTP